MLPPDFKTFDDTPVSQTNGQRWLWDCWLHFAEKSGIFAPDFVIVNGDVVDGPQRKNEASELKLVSPNDQIRAATDVLLELKKMLPPVCKWYFTQGTPYHVGNWGAAEEAVAQNLGAEKYHSIGMGEFCKEVLWLHAGNGVIIEAAHHISTGVGFYRSTAMDRELQWSAMAGKDASKGIPKVALTIRSHVHNYTDVGHATKQGFTTPCWQLQTRYARKASVHRLHPDIGGVFMWVDETKTDKRLCHPCRFEPETYDLPPVQVTNL
jgi:hypothetical protein